MCRGAVISLIGKSFCVETEKTFIASHLIVITLVTCVDWHGLLTSNLNEFSIMNYLEIAVPQLIAIL